MRKSATSTQHPCIRVLWLTKGLLRGLYPNIGLASRAGHPQQERGQSGRADQEADWFGETTGRKSIWSGTVFGTSGMRHNSKQLRQAQAGEHVIETRLVCFFCTCKLWVHRHATNQMFLILGSCRLHTLSCLQLCVMEVTESLQVFKASLAIVLKTFDN